MIATIKLQMLKPVMPSQPKTALDRKPPTIAPTMPRAMSSQKPRPLLLTILLPMKPAMRPNMSQLIIPLMSLRFARLIVAVLGPLSLIACMTLYASAGLPWSKEMSNGIP